MNNNLLFQITIKQQILLISRMFVVPFGMVFLTIYFDLSIDAFIYIFALLFAIDILPTIAIHFNYWHENKNCIIEINKDKKVLVVINGRDKKFEVGFDEIEFFYFFYSIVYNTGWHSFGQYRYCKLVFKDQTQINITCLMVNDIENTLQSTFNLNPIKKRALLCLIK